MRLVCWLLGIWYTLRTTNPFTPLGLVPVSGHEYTEQEPYEAGDKVFHPLSCDRCGEESVAWSWSYR